VRIATWNVNGIRARAAQLNEWLERDRPDIVCLQELKATTAQIPAECRVADYHAYWHTLKGYSGVSLHIRKDLFAFDPVFSHPPFDMESRIVQVEHGDLVIASVYVPNGGKDYPAKLAFVKNLIDWAARLTAEGRQLILCGDLNIAPRNRRTPKGAQTERRGPATRRTRAVRNIARRAARGPRQKIRSRQSQPVHLVGAVAQSPSAQYRLAPRLRAGFPTGRRAGIKLRGAG
jgi:exodeoxyribonuclease III